METKTWNTQFITDIFLYLLWKLSINNVDQKVFDLVIIFELTCFSILLALNNFIFL